MGMWSGRDGQVFEKALKPNKTPRFLVPAGTPCSISPMSKLHWRPYRTRREAGFEKFERYNRGSQSYEFRLEGWLVLVHRRFVIHRDDAKAV